MDLEDSLQERAKSLASTAKLFKSKFDEVRSRLEDFGCQLTVEFEMLGNSKWRDRNNIILGTRNEHGNA